MRLSLAACLLAMLCSPALLAQAPGKMPEEMRADLEQINPAPHVRRLASIKSRLTGYPGCAEAEEYILAQYRALGLANISREPFQTVVPVDRGATLRLRNAEIPLHCVWPNYVRTPKTPETGLGGHLVWGGDGYLADFNGKQVEGSLVIMQFNTATRWLNAAKLGAKAIIFIEPTQAFRADAEQKYMTVPVPTPRYYLQRSSLPALAAAITGGKAEDFTEDDALAAIASLDPDKMVAANVLADMIWDESTVYMLSGEIPGTDPELSRQMLVCHAYYDSTSVVPALAPGAESACGIAAQIEIAKFLLKHPPRRTVKFLATPGHFQGLAGARQYAFKTIYPRRSEETGVKESDKQGEPHFFIGLDLSSRQNTIAAFYKGHFYDQYGADGEIKLQRVLSDYSSLLMDWGEQVTGPGGAAEGLVYQSGIVPQFGRDWRSLLPDVAAFDSEVITVSAHPAITLATTGDPRNTVNTPLDTFESIEPYLENVRKQAILSAYVVKQTADIPAIPLNPGIETGKIASVFGRAIEQKLSDYVPTVNVPDAVASVSLTKYKSMNGVMGRTFARTDAQGLFEFFGLTLGLKGGGDMVVVDGFLLSSSEGSIEAVATPTLVKPSRIKRGEWELRETDLRLSFFDCVSTTIFDMMDPLWLRQITEANAMRGESNSDLQYLVKFVGTPVEGTSYAEPAAVFFTKRDMWLKFLVGGGLTGNDGVLLNVQVDLADKRTAARAQNAEDVFLGTGFKATQSENYVCRTAYQMARDMHLLDYYRLDILERTAIKKQNVWKLHDLAASHLLKAEQKLAERQYDEFYREANMAWALEKRVYPDVRGTANDVVRGVVFYFALLLPFVIFAERLLINYIDIRKKLAAIAGLFAVSYLVLRFVHPAFRLSKTPIIVLDGFFMLAASAWTITYLVMKFQGVMEQIKRHIHTIHRADVARASAAMAAFILGISNMRKRKIRTVLTALTLILLTFTILSFTSFETMPARMLRYASSKKAPYTGVLVRSLAWNALPEFAAYDVTNHFAAEGFTVAPRSWFVSRDKKQELKLEVTRSDDVRARAIASAMLGLSPEERSFTDVGSLIEDGTWFDRNAEGWPFVCLVPTAMKESLRLSSDDMGKASVSVLGRTFRVVGTIDSRRLFQQADLDFEPLTPVDFVEQQYKEQAGGGGAGAGPSFSATGEMSAEDFISRMQQEDQESLYIHMDADRVLVVPDEICVKLGGTIRSMAAGPGTAGEQAAGRSFIHSLTQFASRVNLALFAGVDGFVNRIATRSRLSMGGLQGLLVPILIAALIVFNTMLGAVHERVTEIKVYAAVGLAPIHIGALFFAESCVFAVIGAMMGYLLGQIISFGLIQVPWLMEGISLNYSSISAVWSALLVMAVVIASTAYPARMAGKLSVPDETRKMVIARPTSDVWDIRFPFTVSSKESLGVMSYLRQYFESNDEDSVGAFTADNIKFSRETVEGLTHIVLEADVWVAPLDMGISQSVRIAAVPDAEEPDISYLMFRITRKSGEFATWHRMNMGFLKDLRKQLLIWRLVTPDEKKRLAQEGEAILAGTLHRQT
jgi:hypothetical protein